MIVAALRPDGMTAPAVFDGPIDNAPTQSDRLCAPHSVMRLDRLQPDRNAHRMHQLCGGQRSPRVELGQLLKRARFRGGRVCRIVSMPLPQQPCGRALAAASQIRAASRTDPPARLLVSRL
jgi:hypothetical protein